MADIEYRSSVMMTNLDLIHGVNVPVCRACSKPLLPIQSIKRFSICHDELSYHHTFMSPPTEILLTSHKSDSERDEVDLHVLGAFAADTSGPSDCLKQMDTIFPRNTGILVSIDSEDCPSNGVELASIYIII